MISIIIPAYNEEETIGRVIDNIKTVMKRTKKPYEVIVVDDASTDKTARILKKTNIRTLRHPYNMGYGASLKTGIKHAKGEWILITDADGTYPHDDIPKLLSHTKEYDMVVGARTGSKVHIPLYRKPAKWFLGKLANYLSGRNIADLNSGMRIFRREDVMRFFNILPSGFSFTTTITLAYFSNEYTIKYVPIDYHERKGKSKIRPIKDGANFIVLIVRTITFFNPLKIFLPIALLLFLIGCSAFFYQTIFTRNVEDFTMTFLLTSLQIGFLGLLADMVSKKEVRNE